MSEQQPRGGAMTGGSDAYRNGVVEHYLRNGGHGEAKKLTTNRLEGSLASGKAPRALVDGDGGWREKHGTSEVESGQIQA